MMETADTENSYVTDRRRLSNNYYLSLLTTNTDDVGTQISSWNIQKPEIWSEY